MGLQETIYKLETGQAAGWLRAVAVCLCLLSLTAWYSLTQFSGFSTPEAMDYAQLARSLARSEGFHTQFIRPLALGLQRDYDFISNKGNPPTLNQLIPPEKVDLLHYRDTISPPLYPFVLSGAFRLTGNHFDFPVGTEKAAHIYFPEYVILIFNLLCFFLSAFLVYLLAQRLFDVRVAGLSVALFLACELHWQFAVSGLSTAWTTLLLLGSALSLHESMIADEEDRTPALWGWTLLGALLLGFATLSRYSLLWLVIPYLVTLGVALPKRRILIGVAAAVVLVVFAPWAMRNLSLTGSWFGHSASLIDSETGSYPGTTLGRSYRFPAETLVWKEALRKLFHGTHYLFTDGYREFGANLAAAFFLTGFLHVFRRSRANLLRGFVLGGAIVVALGSSLVKASPGVVDEANQLVLFAPLITIFGAAFFFILLDRIETNFPLIRSSIIVGLILFQSVPLFSSLLLHEVPYFSYPPYYPPILKITSNWLSPSEITMSDIPWATAWYGDRTSLWVPLTLKEFYEINDYASTSPVCTLLLTPQSGNSKLTSEIEKGEWKDWAVILKRQTLPKNFPLSTILPIKPTDDEYLILADRIRWH